MQGMVADDPPASPAEVVAEVKAKKAEWGLEDADVSKVGGVAKRSRERFPGAAWIAGQPRGLSSRPSGAPPHLCWSTLVGGPIRPRFCWKGAALLAGSQAGCLTAAQRSSSACLGISATPLPA